jgi:hypothetical protein
MRSDESRVSKSRASSPDGRGVTPPISEPFPINPQTSASPNAGQPLATQKRVRQAIIIQQRSIPLAFFRNAGSRLIMQARALPRKPRDANTYGTLIHPATFYTPTSKNIFRMTLPCCHDALGLGWVKTFFIDCLVNLFRVQFKVNILINSVRIAPNFERSISIFYAITICAN